MKILLLTSLLSISFVQAYHSEPQSADRFISGIVVSESNEPIVFASVHTKNSEIGTLTDLDRKFHLQIPDTCELLVISYTGYPSQEVNVIGIDSIVVILKAGIMLNSINIIEYKIPLVEFDNTTNCGTKTHEQIRNLPVKNINAIAATTTGSSISIEDVKIKGSRSHTTDYYLDGISYVETTETAPLKTLSDDLLDSRKTEVPQTKINEAYSAGTLTAGEINDFHKWVLWNDKSQEELTAYRAMCNIYPSNRFMVIVQNEAGISVIGQIVHLVDKYESIGPPKQTTPERLNFGVTCLKITIR